MQKTNLWTGQLTWRGVLALVAVLAGGVGLFYGGRMIYQQLQARPKSVAAIKREIFRFLKEKSQSRDFSLNQPAAAADTTSLTNDLVSLQKELNALSFKLTSGQKSVAAKRKQAQNTPSPGAKMARQFRQQFQEAMSWELVYKALGQELWLAEHLLASTNLESRQSGLQLADQARTHALNSAENGWLASRIVEAFIWPNLSLADGTSSKTGNRDQLLVSAGLTFQQAGETNNYIKNAQMLITQSSNPVRADYARYRLACTLEMMGNYEGALKNLRAIQSSNSLVYAAKRIPIVEGKLNSKLRRK